jgi:hypothetical protein
MSLFLQTLILGGILFREQEHRQEHMNLGGPAEACRQAVLKTASRFAGAEELKNAALRPAFGVTSSKSRLK